ncbi:GFA family protein [Providencia sp.]|uniref:GFA family protein n=1 Tax=Providencia sp. TaxID=589 RepID=UPI003F9A82B5
MDKVIAGGCLCGHIQFRAFEPSNVHSCSCDICQKHTGAQMAVWIEFPANRVEWIGKGGKPAVYRSSEYSSRAFCPQCGSSIGAIDDAPTVALLTGVMDNLSSHDLELEYHSFTDLAPKWWCKLLCYDNVEL